MSTGRGSMRTKKPGSRNYVNTKLLRKDLLELGKTVTKTAEGAVQIATGQSTPFAMSFDSVEALPWVQGTNSKIVLSGPALEKAMGGDLESILAAQTQVATETLRAALRKGLKEALE